ncbi:MAG TPA: hypothetical protein VMF08_07530 [Candidatus Sulfotelmatobacter sp.]|nr:hypothetical protein [Candidatus Sulfotelmatobacter sp.]
MDEQQELGAAERRAPLGRLGSELAEYARLGATLAKLYFQSRVLIAQNYILSCKLRMWDAVFVYFKIQIFLIRLSYGFPIGQCWPAE